MWLGGFYKQVSHYVNQEQVSGWHHISRWGSLPYERSPREQAGRTAVSICAAFPQPDRRTGYVITQQKQIALCADHDRHLREQPGRNRVWIRSLSCGATLSNG